MHKIPKKPAFKRSTSYYGRMTIMLLIAIVMLTIIVTMIEVAV